MNPADPAGGYAPYTPYPALPGQEDKSGQQPGYAPGYPPADPAAMSYGAPPQGPAAPYPPAGPPGMMMQPQQQYAPGYGAYQQPPVMVQPGMPQMGAPGMPPPAPGQPAQGNWMAAPQGIANCPPGLEYLASIDQLLVHQKVELLEAFTGFETANKYTVKNTMGQPE